METLSAVSQLSLDSGSRVAVMGGGPAGSLFSYFLLDMANRVGIDLRVDMYEPRDFSLPAPQGCNMCGGIVSESLVQHLATEGVILPPKVVQRGIDSYILHTDVGSIRIMTPLREKRIGAVYRGAGPRGIKEMKWGSFDGHLQSMAVEKGANLIRARVEEVSFVDGRPVIRTKTDSPEPYDLLAVTTGVNSTGLGLFKDSGLEYRPPGTTKTAIREYYLGEETVSKYLGSSMHVFLLNIPRLEFAALVPKGDYVTVCLLGENIDAALLESFLSSAEVAECMPSDWRWDQPACQCWPRINVTPAEHPFSDRVVFIGDSGVTRLYKDGIGASYRMSKAASTTAIFDGVSDGDFARHYATACRTIANDNRIGKMIFMATRLVQKLPFSRRAILRMVAGEQKGSNGAARLSTILWDLFTGSGSYREVLVRGLHPAFLIQLVLHLTASALLSRRALSEEVLWKKVV